MIASLRRIFALLDVEAQVREAPDATVPAAVRGAVRVEGVGLVLDGSRILRNVELAIEPGQVVGLVGPSGAGKSTLAALLARTLDPSEGRIVLGGLELQRWRLGELRRAIGLVPQETQLLHDTQRFADATVLLVAHRLTSLIKADRIFVLDGGHLVEHGTHPELMGRAGLTRTLFDEQMRRMAQA